MNLHGVNSWKYFSSHDMSKFCLQQRKDQNNQITMPSNHRVWKLSTIFLKMTSLHNDVKAPLNDRWPPFLFLIFEVQVKSIKNLSMGTWSHDRKEKKPSHEKILLWPLNKVIIIVIDSYHFPLWWWIETMKFKRTILFLSDDRGYKQWCCF